MPRGLGRFALVLIAFAVSARAFICLPVEAADGRAWWCVDHDWKNKVNYYSDPFSGDLYSGFDKYKQAFDNFVRSHYDTDYTSAYCFVPSVHQDSVEDARSDRDADAAKSRREGLKVVFTQWTD